MYELKLLLTVNGHHINLFFILTMKCVRIGRVTGTKTIVLFGLVNLMGAIETPRKSRQSQKMCWHKVCRT